MRLVVGCMFGVLSITLKYKNIKIMDLKGLTTEKIKQIRECLVGEYIGEWEKPKQYFDQLKEIDTELKTR